MIQSCKGKIANLSKLNNATAQKTVQNIAISPFFNYSKVLMGDQR